MQNKTNRRTFLRKLGQFSALAGLSPIFLPLPKKGNETYSQLGQSENFKFIHFTDTHVQPELRAQLGLRKCIKKMNTVGAAFAIHGGDIVFDVFKTRRARADLLYRIYHEEIKRLQMPVHHVIGNHDAFGVSPASGIKPNDPGYGKKMYKDQVGMGKTYSSFDYGRWHFILLDSIDITSDRSYRGLIDYDQMEWLKTDLQNVGMERPIVVVTHIPLITLFWQIIDDSRTPIPPGISIVNAKKVWELIEPYNVRTVLQGHLHIREKLEYNDVQYITSGAVCGNWWKGPRMGHPEGFAVLEVKGNSISWRYETYGWKAAVPEGKKVAH